MMSKVWAMQIDINFRRMSSACIVWSRTQQNHTTKNGSTEENKSFSYNMGLERNLTGAWSILKVVCAVKLRTL